MPKLPEPEPEFISSREILQATGISRVTLHNYIRRGLVPQPIICRVPNPNGRTGKLGFFPPETLDQIREIRAGKMPPDEDRQQPEPIEERDESADEVADEVGDEGPLYGEGDNGEEAIHAAVGRSRQGLGAISQIRYPAYFVDRDWRIQWLNDGAERLIFGPAVRKTGSLDARHLFRVLLESPRRQQIRNFSDFIRIHATLAAPDLPSPRQNDLLKALSATDQADLTALWPTSSEPHTEPTYVAPITLDHEDLEINEFHLVGCDFREGTFLARNRSGPPGGLRYT